MTPLQLTDPVAPPTYARTRLQLLLEGLVHDPRDVVFLRVTLRAVAVMVPLLALLYWRFSWWLGAAVLAMQIGVLAPPVILMLHNTMHRPFIKGPRWVGRAHAWTMSALFGIPTGYLEHHVAMHHVENNLPSDLSSTMRYQRDSVLHWLVYVLRFLFLIPFELSRYLISKGRGALAVRAVGSDLAHLAAMGVLFTLNWRATLVAFAIPYVVVRVMMMVGNWGQHAFIDPARPGDSLVNSITCINTRYNQRCFNDGYHIGHHVKQNRHWTELPQDLLANAGRYRRAGSIVFEGLDFFIVAVLLFTRRYDVLSRHFVRLADDVRTDAEVSDFLRSRTQRIRPEVRLPAQARPSQA